VGPGARTTGSVETGLGGDGVADATGAGLLAVLVVRETLTPETSA
jgi:hypothetical protein